MIPFRWNTGNPELHRRLARTRAQGSAPSSFRRRLLSASAKVLRAAGEADLVFVGRSLESVYDLLAGALEPTSWRERLQLLQLSLWDDRQISEAGLQELQRYFARLRLTPAGILARERPVAFVDLVYQGLTYGNLATLLFSWCEPRLRA